MNSQPSPHPLQIDVKLSVRGNPRGRGTEAHHQREQTVEVTVYTLRWAGAVETGFCLVFCRTCLEAHHVLRQMAIPVGVTSMLAPNCAQLG